MQEPDFTNVISRFIRRLNTGMCDYSRTKPASLVDHITHYGYLPTKAF